MLNLLRKLLNKSSGPITVAPAATTQEPASVDVDLLDATMSGWFREQNGELLEGFPIHPDDHVLDVGCGDGTYVTYCAQFGPEISFADIDAGKIRDVEARLKNSTARAIHPLVTDANPLPLPDNYANKVIAMEVLEHVDDPAQFLQELIRVGKPGALYLLTVPGSASEGVQKVLAPPVYFEKPNHINIFTQDDIERLVLESGLIIERKTSYGFYASVWWAFFWTCNQDLLAPRHPLLENWAKTWECMLKTRDGPKIKKVLDELLPKSQAIIARKPT